MSFPEPCPDIIAPNPGGPDDPLGESVLDPANPWLRIFEPRTVRLVIGRGQDPRRELRIEAARADGVPIHRRVAGGGAVVLAPGSVVLACRLPRTTPDPDAYFACVNAAIGPALASLTGSAPLCRGHGDLALAGEDGLPRKILGASQRQAGGCVYYLGVLLVADLAPLMERYLRPPSREPAYRAGRGHAAFCTSLDRYGVSVPALLSALSAACRQRWEVDHPQPGREGQCCAP